MRLPVKDKYYQNAPLFILPPSIWTFINNYAYTYTHTIIKSYIHEVGDMNYNTEHSAETYPAVPYIDQEINMFVIL